MQAIILAAGKGSRLGDLTNDQPKSFLEINGQTLLDRNLELLDRSGIDGVVLVTGYQAHLFEERYGNSEAIEIVLNPFYDSSNVLTSFWFGQGQLHGQFLFMHADTIFDPTILERLLAADGDVVLPVDFGPCDEEAMKVQVRDGHVMEINKTMPIESAAGEFIGIAKISERALPEIKRIATELMRQQRFEAFFEVAMQQLIDEDNLNVVAMPTNGAFWSEIDFKEDYESAKARLGATA